MNLDELRLTDQRWVPGSGSTPASLAFVGEAPGREEMKYGMPFVGPAGEINWQLAARYGQVYRGGNYVTNWSKIPQTDFTKKHMTEDERDSWTTALNQELRETVRPQVVAALGGYAVRALLPGVSLFWANGLPIDRGDMVVVPIVHPAAGIHESTMLEKTAQGYKGLRQYLAGEIKARARWEEPGPTHVVGSEWPSYLSGVGTIGIDTEGSAEEPLCLTASTDGKAGWYVAADNLAGLERFRRWLARTRPRIFLHYAVHDAQVLAAMGIDIWQYDVVDTMALAYNLQDLPRGLKDLSKRLLGFNMREYEDVVRPWQEKADESWRGRAYEASTALLTLSQQFTPKGKPRMKGGEPVFKRTGPQVPLSLATHLERQQTLPDNEVRWAEEKIGPRPGLDLRLVPEPERVQYAGTDAIATRLLGPILLKRIEEEGLGAVAELDRKVLPLLDDMERTGLHVDLSRYWEVLGQITTRRIAVIEEIREITGRAEFNPGSADQVEDFCHEVWQKDGRLGLWKPTKSGQRYSTDANVLAMLKDEHPFIPKVIEFRELQRYETGYLLPMRDSIRETDRGFRYFHRLNYTKVVSGRLAGRVLTWPARTKLGLTLRSVFTAPPGKVLVSWDLSQIELRLTAVFSGDKVMTQAFLDGLDLHTNLASKLFGVPYEKVDSFHHRYPTKTVHYLLLYGGGGDKLFEELRGMGVTKYNRHECHKLIEDTWRIYSGAEKYLKGRAEEARRTGYVSDFLGRRRFLPATQLVGDEWPLAHLRYEAERQAGNFDIQSGAGEIIHGAEAAVWENVYPQTGGKLRLWLQVHDELMGEMDAEAFEELDPLMQEAMTGYGWVTHPVPLVAEGKVGMSWGELKGGRDDENEKEDPESRHYNVHGGPVDRSGPICGM